MSAWKKKSKKNKKFKTLIQQKTQHLFYESLEMRLNSNQLLTITILPNQPSISLSNSRLNSIPLSLSPIRTHNPNNNSIHSSSSMNSLYNPKLCQMNKGTNNSKNNHITSSLIINSNKSNQCFINKNFMLIRCSLSLKFKLFKIIKVFITNSSRNKVMKNQYSLTHLKTSINKTLPMLMNTKLKMINLNLLWEMPTRWRKKL